MIKAIAAAAFLALNFYIYNYLATVEVKPPRETLDTFPLELGGWSCAEREEMSEGVIGNLGVTDYLVCNFESQESIVPVGVYVGYHASQVRREGGGSGENSIHPPKHCLPGSGWEIMDAEVVRLEMPGMPPGGSDVNRLLIAHGNKRQLVYYWYQSRGRVIADDRKKIVFLFWDRARRGRTDGSLVRFTVPLLRGQTEIAEDAFREVAREILPRLGPYVPG